MLFKSLLKCSNCNYTFRARKERNHIKYRCSNRLKNGINSCSNDSVITEEELIYHTKKQFELYEKDFNLDNEYLKTVIKDIIVQPNNNYMINYKNKSFDSTII